MVVQTRFNRRTLLQGAAVGTAALGVPGVSKALASRAQAPLAIDFWGPGGDPVGGPVIKKLVDEFNKTAGKAKGIFVRNHYVSTDNNYIKYTTGMTSFNAPDVLYTYGLDPVFPWIANGFVQPLDAYAQELGLKQSSFVPLAWQMIYRNGHIWGLPQEFDFDQLYWNKDVYKGAPPKTFAELDALAPRYVKHDAHGNLVQVGLIPWLYSFNTLATLWGASFYDQEKGKWTITLPQNRKWLEWMLKYVHMYGGRGKPDALVSATPTTYRDLFLYGKSAFAFEGEYIPREIVPLGLAKKLHYGIAAPPSAPGISPKVMQNGANIFLVPVKSKHPKEAATFIMWMVSKSSLLYYACNIGQNLPTRDAEFSKQFVQCQPWMDPWVSYIRQNRVINEPLSPVYPVFSDAMSTAIDEVTYKKKTPAQALAAVDSKVSAAVQRFKEAHPTWSTD